MLQDEFVQLVNSKPFITTSELVARFKVSKRTILILLNKNNFETVVVFPEKILILHKSRLNYLERFRLNLIFAENFFTIVQKEKFVFFGSFDLERLFVKYEVRLAWTLLVDQDFSFPFKNQKWFTTVNVVKVYDPNKYQLIDEWISNIQLYCSKFARDDHQDHISIFPIFSRRDTNFGAELQEFQAFKTAFLRAWTPELDPFNFFDLFQDKVYGDDVECEIQMLLTNEFLNKQANKYFEQVNTIRIQNGFFSFD